MTSRTTGVVTIHTRIKGCRVDITVDADGQPLDVVTRVLRDLARTIASMQHGTPVTALASRDAS